MQWDTIQNICDRRTVFLVGATFLFTYFGNRKDAKVKISLYKP